MIKTTVGVIADSQEALQLLARHRLPEKPFYAVTLALRKTKDEAETYARLQFEVVKKCGVPLDPAQPDGLWTCLPAKRHVYDELMKPVRDTEVELALKPQPLSSLRNAQGEMPALEPAAMVPLLDWLFIDDTAEK